MKLSLAISALVLLVGGLLGFQNKARLKTVAEDHRRAVAEVEALGLSSEVREDGLAAPAKMVRRDGGGSEEKALEIAAEVIAFAKKMKELESNGEQPDEELQKEMMGMMQKFMEMDSSQLKILIAELRESDEIDDETRNGIVGFSIMMLGSEHPEAALALFTESSDMIDMDGMGSHVISTALAKWSSQDPMGALDWIRENEEAHPDLVSGETKVAVLRGAAQQDPALALQLIGELKLDASEAMSGIVSVSKSSEQREALLAAVRTYAESDAEGADGMVSKMMNQLGSTLPKDGFEAAESWLSAVELSEAEEASFASGISSWGLGDDTGSWLNWMGDKLPADVLRVQVRNLMGHWTQEDYKAAGTWLNDAEEGPVKSAAVVTYASTVAPYEPETAAEWAKTLPKGSEQQDLVRQVYEEWKQKDAAAAEGFGREHDLLEAPE